MAECFFASYKLCCPSLHFLQFSDILFVKWCPKLNCILQIWSYQQFCTGVTDLVKIYTMYSYCKLEIWGLAFSVCKSAVLQKKKKSSSTLLFLSIFSMRVNTLIMAVRHLTFWERSTISILVWSECWLPFWTSRLQETVEPRPGNMWSMCQKVSSQPFNR